MNKLRVLFFFGLLVLVIVIARHNSRSTSPAPYPRPTASPQAVAAATAAPTATAAAPASPPAIAQTTPTAATPASRPVNFQKSADQVTPAIALISTFDGSGKLLRSGSGCFVSADGRLLTTSGLVQGAAHAVAKVSDGRIINVSGILADNPALDLALLKVETKKGVPFAQPNNSAPPATGAPVAVVGSTLMHRQPAYFERSIATHGSDAAGDWLGLSAAVPEDCVGAPLINDKGEVVGVLTSQHAQGALANIARSGASTDSFLAKVDPQANATWQVAENADAQPSPPGEGPTKPPIRVTIPVVRADQPGSARLIYTPKPKYPAQARRSTVPLQGEGRFRIRFAANGQVQNVEILESTHNPALDSAATETLRRWKAEPGREWSATVPISFQP